MVWVSLCGGLVLVNVGLGVIYGFVGLLGGLSCVLYGVLCGSLLLFGLVFNELQINDSGLCQCVNDVCCWLVDGLDVFVDWVWDSLWEWSYCVGFGILCDFGVVCDVLELVVLVVSIFLLMKVNLVSLSGEQLLEMLEVVWE